MSVGVINPNALFNFMTQAMQAVTNHDSDKLKDIAKNLTNEVSSLFISIDEGDIRPSLPEPAAHGARKLLELPQPKSAKKPMSAGQYLDLEEQDVAGESVVAFMMEQQGTDVVNAVIGSRRQLAQNLKDRAAFHKERLQELEKAQARLNDAKKAQTASRVCGWFTCIGLGILGGLMIASGVGAAGGVGLIAAGTAMVAGAAITAVDQISEMTGGWLAEGIAALAEGCGMEPNAARLFARIFIASSILVLTLAGGIGSAVALSKGASVAIEGFNQAQMVTQGALALSAVGTGAADVIMGAYKYSSGEHEANSKEAQAAIQQILYHNESIMEELENLVKRAQQGFDIASSINKERQEVKQQLLQFQSF